MPRPILFFSNAISIYFAFTLSLFSLIILIDLPLFHPAKIFFISAFFFLLIARFLLYRYFPEFFFQNKLQEIYISPGGLIFLAASFATVCSLWLFPSLSNISIYLTSYITNFQKFTGLVIVITSLVLTFSRGRLERKYYGICFLLAFLTVTLVNRLNFIVPDRLLAGLNFVGQIFFIASPLFTLRLFFFAPLLKPQPSK